MNKATRKVVAMSDSYGCTTILEYGAVRSGEGKFHGTFADRFQPSDGSGDGAMAGFGDCFRDGNSLISTVHQFDYDS